MKYKQMFFIILYLFFSQHLEAQQLSLEQYREKPAIEIFRAIETRKIVVFSMDNLIKNGFEDQNLAQWEKLMSTVNQLVPTQYHEYLKNIAQAYGVLMKYVKQLHDEYGSGYEKNPKNGNVEFNIKKNPLSKNKVVKLNAIIAELDPLVNQMLAINKTMRVEIETSTPIPDSWLKDQKTGVYKKRFLLGDTLKDAQEVFPEIYKVLEAYKKAVTIDAFLKDQEITDKYKAATLLNKLDSVLYIMQEKLKNNPNDKARMENLGVVQKIILELSKKFPEAVSTLWQARFNTTTNKPALIVFAESGAMHSVLSQLLREVKQLKETSRPAVPPRNKTEAKSK